MKVENRDREIHELILDMLSNTFSDNGRTLILKVKKDELEFYSEYKSEYFFLCKYCGSTFGINEKGKMPPKIKFTIDNLKYHVEFNSCHESQKVTFKEIRNSENFVSIEIY